MDTKRTFLSQNYQNKIYALSWTKLNREKIFSDPVQLPPAPATVMNKQWLAPPLHHQHLHHFHYHMVNPQLNLSDGPTSSPNLKSEQLCYCQCYLRVARVQKLQVRPGLAKIDPICKITQKRTPNFWLFLNKAKWASCRQRLAQRN